MTTLPLWTPAAVEIRMRLLLAILAKKGHGKTTFALGANPPIYYYKFETGDEGVIEKFAAAGKEIYTYKVYYNHNNYEEVYNGFLDHLTQTCIYLREQDSPGTIIIDTMSEVYELSRFFHFGGRQNQVDRAYAPVYVDMKEIVRMIEGAGVNGIFVHQLADSRDDKVTLADGSVVPATYMKGWKDIIYDMQVVLELDRLGDPPDERYLALIKECRQKGMLKNQWLEGEFEGVDTGGVVRHPLSFDYLLRWVHA